MCWYTNIQQSLEAIHTETTSVVNDMVESIPDNCTTFHLSHEWEEARNEGETYLIDERDLFPFGLIIKSSGIHRTFWRREFPRRVSQSTEAPPRCFRLGTTDRKSFIWDPYDQYASTRFQRFSLSIERDAKFDSIVTAARVTRVFSVRPPQRYCQSTATAALAAINTV